MISFLQTIWFLCVLLAVFVIPGWLLLRAFFDTRRFTLFEWSLLSVATSFASLDFLILSLFYIFHIHITTISITLALLMEVVFWCIIIKLRNRQTQSFLSSRFSSREYLLLLLIFILTFGVKTAFLSSSVTPSATDLGHHMYWANLISTTGEIPDYSKRDILSIDGYYKLSEPQPIADFIIGEHIPFATIHLLTNMSYFSAFPIILLSFVNICSILALFTLAWRLFYTPGKFKHAKIITIFSFLLIGPIYAISSPQTKFVSGGVIGNTIGNLFIPLLWLIYYRALKEKNSSLLTLGFFLTFGLVYTHHLSTLMFIVGFFISLLFILILRPKKLYGTLKGWFDIGLKPAPILFIISAILFFFFVIPPSYADPKAIGTAVGAPTKATRVGLPFLEFTIGTIGMLRMAFGLFGLFLLGTLLQKKRLVAAILGGWTISLLLLSLKPEWAFINIPSNRVATYAIFPLTLLSGFAITLCIEYLRNKYNKNTLIVPLWISGFVFVIWSGLGLGNGLFDNAQNFSDGNKNQFVLETFSASQFIARVVTPDALVLKDHNYLVADSWIKHFFLRDYNFPLSRGYFKRYEDNTKTREQCTLQMISTPNTPKGKKCYDDLDVSYIMINPHMDRKQFERSSEFSLVYLSDSVAIYFRNPSQNSL